MNDDRFEGCPVIANCSNGSHDWHPLPKKPERSGRGMPTWAVVVIVVAAAAVVLGGGGVTTWLAFR
ncbi:hypothetical protein C4552_04630 [Candidatus Parcubacteria bacterium]|nr:MAG: hypothetical protein C4552_04630 [Candidatus Parcubacteria bacterium]